MVGVVAVHEFTQIASDRHSIGIYAFQRLTEGHQVVTAKQLLGISQQIQGFLHGAGIPDVNQGNLTVIQQACSFKVLKVVCPFLFCRTDD
ncbi:hypothetical protein D3C86_1952040 [compost metagenome]